MPIRPRSRKTSSIDGKRSDNLRNDWSFANLKQRDTLWGPHGYHRYPAKFIPQLVRCIIEEYSNKGALVGDPFLGSATTGVEALRCQRRVFGADINPVAALISRAKCVPLDPKRLERVCQSVFEELGTLPRIGRRLLSKSEKDKILAIDIARASPEERFEYWFPVVHAKVLEQILEVIIELRGEGFRTFFLCAFSNILRSCSIWLSGSTKPQKDLTKVLSDPVSAFSRQVRDMMRRNEFYWSELRALYANPRAIIAQTYIGMHDARDLPLQDEELDLLVTSPPYATCYQYLELHQLTQLWFERHGILGAVRLRHHCIGGMSRVKYEDEESTSSAAANRAIRRLTNKGDGPNDQAVRRAVIALKAYFQDMNSVIAEFARVVGPRKNLVLVVGDSCKWSVKIPTSTALCEIADAHGFRLERRIVRRIPKRVLVSTRDSATGRFSSIGESDTQVYPEEDILIFRRAKSSLR